MGKPVPGQNGGIIPPDTDLFSVSMLVTIAALAVLGVAVAVGVVHRSTLASENHGSAVMTTSKILLMLPQQ